MNFIKFYGIEYLIDKELGNYMIWVMNGNRHREGGPAMIADIKSGVIEMWLENGEFKQFGDDALGPNYSQEAPERPNVIRKVKSHKGDLGTPMTIVTMLEWLNDHHPDTGEVFDTWDSNLIVRSIGDDGKIYKWDDYDRAERHFAARIEYGSDWPPLSPEEIAALFAKYNDPDMRKAEWDKWTSKEYGYEDFGNY